MVGAGTSGVDDPVFRYAGRLYWWFASNILTVRTPIGRKAKSSIIKGGGPLVNVSVKDLIDAAVEQVSRVAGVEMLLILQSISTSIIIGTIRFK